MLNSFAAAGVAMSMLAPAVPADVPVVPPPGEKITVDVLTVNGSGCPAGTADVIESPDNTGFRIYYDNYLARNGGSSAPTDFRKNCQIGLKVHVPQGYSYSITKVDYRGYARLGDGSHALQRANYYFQGDSANNYQDHVLDGPLSGSWRTTDFTADENLVWSPCGEDRNLNINTELRVYGDGANWINMSSTGGKIYTVYEFSWKTCP
ncbi:DUF4360 domain-containing protein [Pseudonocardiaceae bacterium YIM PH 21723]|nr:DUF4360 domain-containing protein [Pseudonocardiaceae bacterium YIM PH 21723]